MIGIYKYTNNINKKSYIGQSVNIENRKRQHLASAYYKKSNTYNTIFHQAIRKYGIENFTFEIITICPVEELNILEKFYIKKEQTLVPLGYNMTTGGENSRSYNCLFSEEEIKEIIFELRNTYDKTDEIGTRWGCSGSLIKKISSGEEYYVQGETYPIRSKEHSLEIIKRYNPCHLGENPSAKLNIETVEEIIYDLLHTTTNIKDLAIKYNISSDQISRINNGKVWLQVERPIPCRNIKKENEEKALMVANLLQNTSLNQKQIMELTGYKDRHTISRINNHTIYKDLLQNFNNPIRKL